MTKNFIIFGAGASYGSDSLGVPPKASKLLSELAVFNPTGWGKLTGEFKLVLVEDFEKGVIKIATEMSHDLSILQRVMADFFFRFQPRDTNLYYRLAKKLKENNKNVALSTLNYERLLDISFLAADHKVNIGNSPNDEIELNLPHGACYLFCESARALASAVSFSGMNVQVNGEIKIISDPTEFQQRITQDAFPPVMSYFEPQKRTTAGQDFINTQRQRFSELCTEAEQIIIIGVKIREHDSHIWDAIKNSNASLIYCSGNNEKVNFDNWVANNRKGKTNISLSGYWAENFEEILNYLK